MTLKEKLERTEQLEARKRKAGNYELADKLHDKVFEIDLMLAGEKPLVRENGCQVEYVPEIEKLVVTHSYGDVALETDSIEDALKEFNFRNSLEGGEVRRQLI